MNTNELKNYKPYSSARNRNADYAEITFQNESVMTVPKNSEQTIVKMLNDAFQNGVNITLNNISSNKTGTLNSGLVGNTTIEKSINKTPVEDSQPINSFRKK